MKNNNKTKEFEKKIYKQPEMKEIGSLIKHTKNQGISGTQDNGSTVNPFYS